MRRIASSLIAVLALAVCGACDPTTQTQVTVGGLVFDVRVSGPASGEPVLLLHGFPQTSYEWRHQIRALSAAGYRVFAPDQRGYSPGARPAAESDYTTDKLASDVLGIASALGLPRFHLVGHDWGAGIGWLLAARAPERVASFVSVSIPHPDAMQQQLTNIFSCQFNASSYFDLFDSPTSTDLLLGADGFLLRTAVYQGVPADAVPVYMAALGNRPALDAALSWYRANIQSRRLLSAPIGPVSVPTRVIWGDGDAYVCRDTVEATSRFMSGPHSLHFLAGVNHWAPETGADKVSEIVLGHLRAHPL